MKVWLVFYIKMLGILAFWTLMFGIISPWLLSKDDTFLNIVGMVAAALSLFFAFWWTKVVAFELYAKLSQRKIK